MHTPAPPDVRIGAKRRPLLPLAAIVLTSLPFTGVSPTVATAQLTAATPMVLDVAVDPNGELVSPVRPSVLAHLIDELAGHKVRVRHAKVVGVFNPQAFVIESFLAMLGTRDRLIVLVEGAELHVSAEAVVGANVVVAGVARTLLGLQTTREVPWPPELTREAIKRLEIRAAVLATSVQTAEGVELTVRPRRPL
jgi:hypothetical protein